MVTLCPWLINVFAIFNRRIGITSVARIKTTHVQFPFYVKLFRNTCANARQSVFTPWSKSIRSKYTSTTSYRLSQLYVWIRLGFLSIGMIGHIHMCRFMLLVSAVVKTITVQIRFSPYFLAQFCAGQRAIHPSEWNDRLGGRHWHYSALRQPSSWSSHPYPAQMHPVPILRQLSDS